MTRHVIAFADTFGRLCFCTRDIRRAARRGPQGRWTLYSAVPSWRVVDERGSTDNEALAALWVAEGALP